MKLRAHILLRNRSWKTVSVDSAKSDFSFRGGLYVLSMSAIKQGPKGPELFYFEDNPTPLKPDKSDDSTVFLDDLILDNFIIQVQGEMPSRGSIFGFLKPFAENPGYLVGAVLVLAVLYAVIAGGFKI